MADAVNPSVAFDPIAESASTFLPFDAPGPGNLEFSDLDTNPISEIRVVLERPQDGAALISARKIYSSLSGAIFLTRGGTYYVNVADNSNGDRKMVFKPADLPSTGASQIALTGEALLRPLVWNAQTKVSVAGDTAIASALGTRRYLYLFNPGSIAVWIKFGATAVIGEGHCIPAGSGIAWTPNQNPLLTDAVRGITNDGATSIDVAVAEGV